MEKKQLYLELNKNLTALLKDEINFISILANTSALLYEWLPDVNWVGFYLLQGDELHLGPFQGKVACSRIPLGKGVCGACVMQSRIQRVDDVGCFPDHIVCDSDSRSEIVLPVCNINKIIGVLDVDSKLYNRFDIDDEKGLGDIVGQLQKKLLDTI